MPQPKKTPQLTVVIPHLNAGDGLGLCLESLAHQEREIDGLAVIVVDNGSAELPTLICDRHPFVTLLEESVPGPGPARSRGARHAQSDLLAFIDADCIAGPGWLAGIVDHFTRHPETGVLGGDVRIACADPARPTGIEAYESVYGYRMKLYVERDHYTATCNMGVRRDLFLAVGDFGGLGIAEDMEWGQRASAQGIRIDYVPQIRISTPARGSFAELARKWDRHVGHDFSVVTSPRDRLRWGAKALALALSPLPEALRIARSDRISGAGTRLRGLACLTRVRLYRARRMLALLLGGDGRALAEGWRG